MKLPAILISLGLLLAVVGCESSQSSSAPLRPPPISAPVVAGQEAKDKAITEQATAIRTEHPPAAPRADAILAAIAAAPAADVASLAAQFDAAIKDRDDRIRSLQSQLARVTKERDDLKNGVRRAVTIMLYGLSALLVAGGVVIALLGAKVAIFGPRAGMSVIAAGGSLFALASAFDWLQRNPWAVGISLAFLAVGAAFMFANHLWAKEEKTEG